MGLRTPLRSQIANIYRLSYQNESCFQNEIEAGLTRVFGLLADCRKLHYIQVEETLDELDMLISSEESNAKYETVLEAATKMAICENACEFHLYDSDGTHIVFHDKDLGCEYRQITDSKN